MVGSEDEKLTNLFRQWLSAFAEILDTDDESEDALRQLRNIEIEIAETPSEGLRGLVVKLGLHRFLNDEDPSIQAESAYRDLVRLTGHDPVMEISSGSKHAGTKTREGERRLR